jgi:threonine dehydratase
MASMSLFDEVMRAEERVRAHVRETPVEPSDVLGALGNCTVHLKCENFQRTGSFKFRGAISKILALSEAERSRGVVTASTGNHGLAVSLAARLLGIPATIYHPVDASKTKLEGIGALGATPVAFGEDCVLCEGEARAHVQREGLAYVSPYNDIQVAAGQGTLAVELSRQLDGVDAVFVSVGGGGLISGVGAFLKQWQPHVQVYGCSPVNSAVMLHSLASEDLLEMTSLPTLSDGTAGGVEAGSITHGYCQSLIDHPVFVSEAEIAEAMRLVIGRHHMLVEGAAGAAVAGFLQKAPELKGKRVVIVLCGANLGVETLREVLCVS